MAGAGIHGSNMRRLTAEAVAALRDLAWVLLQGGCCPSAEAEKHAKAADGMVHVLEMKKKKEYHEYVNCSTEDLTWEVGQGPARRMWPWTDVVLEEGAKVEAEPYLEVRYNPHNVVRAACPCLVQFLLALA